jgi:hypothetical protein
VCSHRNREAVVQNRSGTLRLHCSRGAPIAHPRLGTRRAPSRCAAERDSTNVRCRDEDCLSSFFSNQAAGTDALRNDRRALIAWLGGRRPAKYCESNARRAAATVGPIPTIPSSTLGPSNAIQSSPRKNNPGRRTADGLPGWALQ